MSSIAGASGGSITGGKNRIRWPEVVGMLAEEAAKVIKKDMPDADIEVMWSDEPASMDLVPDRVRLFVDTVAKTPTAELEPAGHKSSWPEVVGMSAEEALKKIRSQKPNADVEVVPVGRPVDADLKANRVRIFVDTVVDVPSVG
ncbi:subtilisin-chymotrypsin inhibitor CI-1A-like [Panicum virgatum]|uniref:Uncharacterized protein n=1 Tax=Panicum virgatum TaxID=38727 RepID=A0A8T0R904_PANVG|nr:subtilisin-chymotrypsin inhibitor CI-1A-like [Panicum virgatum]KAG2581565.1 hypothetical protein PVAP13_6KG054300 [Panicum virgatum]